MKKGENYLCVFYYYQKQRTCLILSSRSLRNLSHQISDIIAFAFGRWQHRLLLNYTFPCSLTTSCKINETRKYLRIKSNGSTKDI